MPPTYSRISKVLFALGMVAGVLAFGISSIAGFWPSLVETLYARSVYPIIAIILSAVSSKVDISIAAIVAAILIAEILVPVLRMMFLTMRQPKAWRRNLGDGLVACLGACGWIFVLFIGVWGLNYRREAPTVIFQATTPLSDADQATLLMRAVKTTNDLRAGLWVPTDCISNPASLELLDEPVQKAQEDLFSANSLPNFPRVPAKVAPYSSFMLKYGATGIYSPFTGEHHVAWPGPPGVTAFTMAHERAHFAGFASENAANFVAFLTTWSSTSPEVRYSGWLAFWRFFKGDTEALSLAVKRDISCVTAFMAERRIPSADVAWSAYDGYLKSQGVVNGRGSYRTGSIEVLRYLAVHPVLFSP